MIGMFGPHHGEAPVQAGDARVSCAHVVLHPWLILFISVSRTPAVASPIGLQTEMSP